MKEGPFHAPLCAQYSGGCWNSHPIRYDHSNPMDHTNQNTVIIIYGTIQFKNVHRLVKFYFLMKLPRHGDQIVCEEGCHLTWESRWHWTSCRFIWARDSFLLPGPWLEIKKIWFSKIITRWHPLKRYSATWLRQLIIADPNDCWPDPDPGTYKKS